MLHVSTYRMLALASALLLCFTFAYAEGKDAEVPDSTGWFGIYEDGAKLGYANWSIERRDIGDRFYYSFKMEQKLVREKRGKEVESTFSYDAKLTSSLAAKSVKYSEKKGSRKGGAEVKVSNGTASYVVQYSGRAMPPQKIDVSETTTWQFCGPLVFAWRRHEPGKPATYRRIHPMLTRHLEDELTSLNTKEDFEGEDVPVHKWGNEAGDVEIVISEEGELLYFVEQGLKFVVESEELARSSFNWQEMRDKREAEAQPEEKPKEEGDGKNPFPDTLDPVGLNELVSDGGDYLKLEMKNEKFFSMRAAEGWQFRHLQLQWYQILTNQPVLGDAWILDGVGDISIKTDRDELREIMLEVCEAKGDEVEYQFKDKVAIFEVEGVLCGAYDIAYLHEGDWSRTLKYVMIGEKRLASIGFISDKEFFDDKEDDIYAMCGSARMDQ